MLVSSCSYYHDSSTVYPINVIVAYSEVKCSINVSLLILMWEKDIFAHPLLSESVAIMLIVSVVKGLRGFIDHTLVHLCRRQRRYHLVNPLTPEFSDSFDRNLSTVDAVHMVPMDWLLTCISCVNV